MAIRATADTVQIPEGSAILDSDLHIPLSCAGLVIFAHGSGSSRFSPRNRQVAESLERAEDAVDV